MISIGFSSWAMTEPANTGGVSANGTFNVDGVKDGSQYLQILSTVFPVCCVDGFVSTATKTVIYTSSITARVLINLANCRTAGLIVGQSMAINNKITQSLKSGKTSTLAFVSSTYLSAVNFSYAYSLNTSGLANPTTGTPVNLSFSSSGTYYYGEGAVTIPNVSSTENNLYVDFAFPVDCSSVSSSFNTTIYNEVVNNLTFNYSSGI
jgi:hypothetical protein